VRATCLVSERESKPSYPPGGYAAFCHRHPVHPSCVHRPITYAQAYERKLHSLKREAVTHRGHQRERTGERKRFRVSRSPRSAIPACRDLAGVRHASGRSAAVDGNEDALRSHGSKDDDPAEARAVDLHRVAAGHPDAHVRRHAAAAARLALPLDRLVWLDPQLAIGNAGTVEPEPVRAVQSPPPDQHRPR